MNPIRHGDLALALALVLLSLLALFYVLASFPGREQVYPASLLLLLSGFALIQLAKLIIAFRVQKPLRKKMMDHSDLTAISRQSNFWITAGATALYLLSVSLLGFSVASFVFIMALAWMVGYRKMIVVLWVDVLIIAAVHLLFARLHVPVPQGLIWRLLS